LIKREITYTFIDDEDKEVTETGIFWFHLYEEELLEWESKYKEGLGETLQKFLKEEDKENLFAFFKKIILDAYGVREDGGRTFDKSPELRRKFERHVAYKKLFSELTLAENSDEAMAQFINGIMPKFVTDQDKPAAIPTKSAP
jgi:hypothetical protein